MPAARRVLQETPSRNLHRCGTYRRASRPWPYELPISHIAREPARLKKSYTPGSFVLSKVLLIVPHLLSTPSRMRSNIQYEEGISLLFFSKIDIRIERASSRDRTPRSKECRRLPMASFSNLSVHCSTWAESEHKLSCQVVIICGDSKYSKGR